MPSVNALLTIVLRAFGEATGPTPDLTTALALELREQLLHTYRVRIPQFVPGFLRQGIVTRTIADPGAPIAEDATGIYLWPSDLAVPHKPLILVDANDSESRPRWFTHPDDFWSCYDLSDESLGTPSGVLVYGGAWRFRQIPNPALGPFELTCYGDLYPPAPANDTGDLIPMSLRDAIVSGTIVFQAKNDGWDDLAGRYEPLWEAALRILTGLETSKSQQVYRGGPF